MRGLIVIPAYNEEKNITRVLSRLQATSPTEDIIVINDGSSDGTRNVLKKLGVNHINHPVNLGYVRALQTGIMFAREREYEYLIFIDGDGQHDPAEIADLRRVGLADDGPSVVIGSRFVGDKGYKAPLGRKLGMLLFSYLTRVFGGKRIHDTTSGFKLLHRRAFDLVVDQIYGDFHSEMIIFCGLAGLRVEEVPITVAQREFGVSMYNWFSSLMYPVRTVLAIMVLWGGSRRLRAAGATAEHV
jgi:glycosyltransferase involved in cell wall biosynthesis